MWFSRWAMTANVAPEPHNSEYPCHYPRFTPSPCPTITEIYGRQMKNYRNSKNIFRRSVSLSEQFWRTQLLLRTRGAGPELRFSWRSKRFWGLPVLPFKLWSSATASKGHEAEEGGPAQIPPASLFYVYQPRPVLGTYLKQKGPTSRELNSLRLQTSLSVKRCLSDFKKEN